MTRDQVNCLLANSFLCNLTQLKLPEGHRSCSEAQFGHLSWHRAYKGRTTVAAQRVKGLLLSLDRALKSSGDGHADQTPVTFRRRRIPDSLDLSEVIDAKGNTPLATVLFFDGNMEDQQQTDILLDFANKNLHIGSILPSATQEEILFTLHPEAFPGIILSETMTDREAIHICNLRQFVTSDGYNQTFKVKGIVPEDSQQYSVNRTLIAVDASVKLTERQQLQRRHFDRDVVKLVTGFSGMEGEKIATGNWGCGCFGGNIYIKFLQQVLAASVAGVDLVYCHSDNSAAVRRDLANIYKGLIDNGITLSEVYNTLVDHKTDSPGDIGEFILDKWR